MKNKLSEVSTVISYIQAIVISFALLIFFGSCDSKGKPGEANGKLKIVTTTGMIKDAVEHVVGDKAEVIALMGPGVDPHLYKATQGDLQKLTNADVIFYNGLHLEGKMGEVLEKLGKTKPVVAVASKIKEEDLRTIPGFQGTHDPHIWFDVKLWENAVIAVSDFMKTHDKPNADLYEGNSKKYLTRLEEISFYRLKNCLHSL